jgi:hypothetical protein
MRGRENVLEGGSRKRRGEEGGEEFGATSRRVSTIVVIEARLTRPRVQAQFR